MTFCQLIFHFQLTLFLNIFVCLLFYRNLTETKPSGSSATTQVETPKPGLTLNPLTGLPYTKKYLDIFCFCKH